MATTKAIEDLLQKLAAGKVTPEDRQALLATLKGLEAQEVEHQRLLDAVAKLVRHMREGGFWNEWEERETHEVLAGSVLSDEEKEPLAKCLEERDSKDLANVRRIEKLKADVVQDLKTMRATIDESLDYLTYATTYTQGDAFLDYLGKCVCGVLANHGVSRQDFDEHLQQILLPYETDAVRSWRASTGNYANALDQTMRFDVAAYRRKVEDFRVHTREALEKSRKEQERQQLAWLERKRLQDQRETKLVSGGDPIFQPGEVLPKEL